MNFNPRSREGSDILPLCNNLCIRLFQSSLPRGERRDAGVLLLCSLYPISILAPARGATILRAAPYPDKPSFQSSLPRGERRREHSLRWEIRHYFNPRSREGSDAPKTWRRRSFNNFNPRSREGSDLFAISATLPVIVISILAPARGAT